MAIRRGSVVRIFPVSRTRRLLLNSLQARKVAALEFILSKQCFSEAVGVCMLSVSHPRRHGLVDLLKGQLSTRIESLKLAH